MRRVLPGFCLALSVLLVGGQVLAEEVRLVYEDFPPFEYQQDGEAQGESVALIRQVCAELGLTPVFMHRPWARALDDVRTGHADGIFSLFRSEERERSLIFAQQPLAHDETVVFVARGDLHPESLEDLAGLRVGLVRGHHYGSGVVERIPGSLQLFKDVRTMFAMLCEGRIDAAMVARSPGEHFLKQLDCGDQVREVLVLAQMSLHIAFSRLDEAHGKRLAEAFSRELARMEAARRGGREAASE
ncbi:MAG: transporter substrate-binding domain-containing protein [Pseudodesulfovibrio sp.]|nr:MULTISPECIES: transporter substrate-binding domain-containing protein [Pseudodesulfovibrio]MBU4193241.1 transporter substrate-binding domain-containing protein [Pseudomonadota bacterium]MBU4244561.1 transporter substrate-binding domain-containing protein [Pseudomonadota bacterium]MBU4380269.1 transporter substrate-binding domain-containing protein [Pseudomonadota bacterium]MBU4476311.1 transporter substrate-binding domain-containing protein [Pseudomonadota bacterium]MBU4516048.1 transporter